MVAVVLAFAAAAAPARASVLVDGLLTAAASPDKAEAITALLLLAKVEKLPDELVERLRRERDAERDPLRKLVLAYVVSAFTVEERDGKVFVDLYPEGRAQALVWNMEDWYSSIPSPLETHLIGEARGSDEALRKLVSGVPYADGYYLGAILDELKFLRRHSAYTAKRLDAALKKTGVTPRQAQLDE